MECIQMNRHETDMEMGLENFLKFVINTTNYDNLTEGRTQHISNHLFLSR